MMGRAAGTRDRSPSRTGRAVRRRSFMIAGLAIASTTAACAVTNGYDEQKADIPVHIDTDRSGFLEARVCRPPASPDLPRIVVFNHGAPYEGGDPASLRPIACDSEPARWFMAHNFVVVAALRRGFGHSTGPVAEGGGPCSNPDFLRAGEQSAHDVAATVRYALALPGVDPKGAVVVGESTGGWATIAYADRADPDVALLVDVEGGRTGPPGHPCGARRLIEAAGTFGAQAIRPMLWIYAENDSYFPPGVANAMHTTFTGAGGHADFVMAPRFGREGHGLFEARGGSAIWGPIVAARLGDAPAHAISSGKVQTADATP